MNEYTKYVDDEEVTAIEKAANALLPEGWRFNTYTFLCRDTPGTYLPYTPNTCIGLDVGFGNDPQIYPTYITIEEAQSFRDMLYALPTSGGSFIVGANKQLGDPFKVRRAGRGIRFEQMDSSSGKPTGIKTTIAANTVYLVCMAVDDMIAAARIEERKQIEHHQMCERLERSRIERAG
ncbi:hypothetical protein KBY27_22720 [Ruegeria pomeroyi]|uniref:Uncharacterized protein n=1 Tax=Ruegeria pomeroyi TaxID=89184 RepID=A0A9Q3ZTG7_9RHOB|nr:hypothetical protein [Ruegeria pomeroyi]MCE8540287.1 hypothetical protein [Ruegeria pomeroyi]